MTESLHDAIKKIAAEAKKPLDEAFHEKLAVATTAASELTQAINNQNIQFFVKSLGPSYIGALKYAFALNVVGANREIAFFEFSIGLNEPHLITFLDLFKMRQTPQEILSLKQFEDIIIDMLRQNQQMIKSIVASN